MHIADQLMSYIASLVSFGERQGEQENAAAQWIQQTLSDAGVAFDVQSFNTHIPDVKKELLVVDGTRVPCKATCFVSGEITNNFSLVSSLIGTQPLIDQSNINFNPHSDAISRGNHYFAPSIAVCKSDIPAILNATELHAEVVVEKKAHTSQNILIGNMRDPKHVLVCHYDSIGPGATDNASGTAMLMALAIHNQDALKDTLFLIGGNEEVSYDYPLYWGHGYRAFESAYPEVFFHATQITVVDCVGDGPVTFDSDIDTVRLGFPVATLESLIPKTRLVYGSFDALMRVYQSDIDVPDVLHSAYLEETYEALRDTLE